MRHIWERGEVHNELRWGDMERDHVEDLVVDGGH
jgi:hypothetical protein